MSAGRPSPKLPRLLLWNAIASVSWGPVARGSRCRRVSECHRTHYTIRSRRGDSFTVRTIFSTFLVRRPGLRTGSDQLGRVQLEGDGQGEQRFGRGPWPLAGDQPSHAGLAEASAAGCLSLGDAESGEAVGDQPRQGGVHEGDSGSLRGRGT